MSFSSDSGSLDVTTTTEYDMNTSTTEYITDPPVSVYVDSYDSGSLDVTTTTVYDMNTSTTEYITDPPVSVYVESDRLIPSYHNTVVYTDTAPSTTYVVESDDSCFCLGGLCAALFCCCPSD